MSQQEMSEAGIQVEAAHELSKLVQPLIRQIIRGMRIRRATPTTVSGSQTVNTPMSGISQRLYSAVQED